MEGEAYSQTHSRTRGLGGESVLPGVLMLHCHFPKCNARRIQCLPHSRKQFMNARKKSGRFGHGAGFTQNIHQIPCDSSHDRPQTNHFTKGSSWLWFANRSLLQFMLIFRNPEETWRVKSHKAICPIFHYLLSTHGTFSSPSPLLLPTSAPRLSRSLSIGTPSGQSTELSSRRSEPSNSKPLPFNCICSRRQKGLHRTLRHSEWGLQQIPQRRASLASVLGLRAWGEERIILTAGEIMANNYKWLSKRNYLSIHIKLLSILLIEKICSTQFTNNNKIYNTPYGISYQSILTKCFCWFLLNYDIQNQPARWLGWHEWIPVHPGWCHFSLSLPHLDTDQNIPRDPPFCGWELLSSQPYQVQVEGQKTELGFSKLPHWLAQAHQDIRCDPKQPRFIMSYLW